MSLGSAAEKYLPLACGAITLLASVVWQGSIMAIFKEFNLTVVGLYEAVFGWSAIQTGFLFAVYGFVVGTKEGFIEKVRETTPMASFLSYTWRAMVIGFALTFVSMPLMVKNTEIYDASPFLYLLITLWFSLFVWAFLGFARVAYLFGLLMRSKKPDPIPG